MRSSTEATRLGGVQYVGGPSEAKTNGTRSGVPRMLDSSQKRETIIHERDVPTRTIG
jgi:hypothetical protein